jgi:hypothetical protein
MHILVVQPYDEVLGHSEKTSSVRTGREDISATRNQVDGTIAAFLGRNLLVDQRSGPKSISVFDHGTSGSGEFIRSHVFRCT